MQLSKSALQPCSSGEAGGETKPNPASAALSLPGFSPQQVNSLSKLFLKDRSDPTPIPAYQIPIFVTVPGSHLKHKRNVKTREQYKRKKAAQALHVTVQEVDHSQEVDSLRISVEKEASKSTVLKRMTLWNCVATSLHAVISRFGMTSFGTIMIQNGVIGMRRMGVG